MKRIDLPGKESGNSPYRVPEGYFDRLTENVMARLPQTEMRRKKNAVRLPYWLATSGVAAALLVAFLPYATVPHNADVTPPLLSQTALSNVSAVDEDALLDYLMEDNIYIYDYATENE